MADGIGPQSSNQQPNENNQNINNNQSSEQIKKQTESIENEIKKSNYIYSKFISNYSKTTEKIKKELYSFNKKMSESLESSINMYNEMGAQREPTAVLGLGGGTSRTISELTKNKNQTSHVDLYNKNVSETVGLFEDFKKRLDLSGKKYDELKKSAKELDEVQQEIIKSYKKGKLDIGSREELLKLLAKDRTIIKESKETPHSESYEDTKKVGTNLANQVLDKFGLSMESLNLPSVILAIFNNMDMGRILGGFAGRTAEVFGKMGKMASLEFNASFTETTNMAGSSWFATNRFVTDQLRNQILQDFYKMGLQIKGVSGSMFAGMTNDLIILSEGFKIPLDNIAKYTFQFQDVFRKNTAQAMLSVKNVINEAYNLGVAPERFLRLIADQTEQFKLQRIQISEVSDVYRRFYSGLNVGIEMSEQLTQSVISSLAQLSSGKLAAYISLTTGLGGKDLTNTMLDFYRGSASGQNTTNSRLELVQKTLKELQTKFPEIQQNQYVGVKAVMDIFGIQQMEVGVKLYDALSKQVKGVSTSNDIMNEVNGILTDTKSAMEQGVNLIVNFLSTILRIIVGAYKFFTFGKMDDSFLKPLSDELFKYNQHKLDDINASDDTKQGLSKLDVIMIQQAKSVEHLSNISKSTQELNINTLKATGFNIAALGALPLPGGQADMGPILKNLTDAIDKLNKEGTKVDVRLGNDTKSLLMIDQVNRIYA
jgi:hypothetical protein